MKIVLDFFGRKKWLVGVVVVLVLVGLWWFNKSKQPALSKSGKTRQLFTVTARNLKSALSISGTVQAEEKVTLQFQTSGKLAWVGVKEGDRVEKYQALASLDQRDLQKSLKKKLLDFTTSRWTVDQWRDDNKSAATGDTNTYMSDKLTRIAQENQFSLDKTILDVELSQLSIEIATLITPIGGVVTHVDQPYAGVNITPATARFEVINPDTLYLKGLVDQQDVVKIRENSHADIIFDAFPDETYRGILYYIAFSPESTDENSYLIKVKLPATILGKVRLGMGAEVSINTLQKNGVLAVPLESIEEQGTKKFSTIQTKTGETRKQVITGLETDEYVEIKRGLKKDDVIIY